MRRPLYTLTSSAALAGLLLLAGCGGCNGGNADTMNDDAAGQTDGATMGDDHDHDHAAGDGHDHTMGDGHDHGDVTGDTLSREGVDQMEPRTFMDITYDTPTAERAGTTEALNGLRANLKAELDALRERMKGAGADKEALKADQQRAAELAQGLERIDRLIKKIGDADDVSWEQARESHLKEAEEVRVWMSEYGLNNSI